mmetsp:Transcript_20395/g.26374  ORF Transcript_20395/g.26374 Transcript_20395/m.26374 type:complete len:125 (-) Transcript_20395:314-688(-)
MASRQHNLSKTWSGDQSQASNVTSANNDWKRKNEASRDELVRFLEQNGEMERLRGLLRKKLADCGWHEEMRNISKSYIRSRGLDQVTFDELVAEITPKGRASVPENVKVDLLQEIRNSAKFSPS